MEQVLLVVQVIVTLAMIVAILVQRSDSDGFGLSGGGGNNLFTGRGAANTMTRITSILAAVFMANALLLGVLAAHNHSRSIVSTIEEKAADSPAVPAVPAADATAPVRDEKTAPVPEKAAKGADQKEQAPAVPAADADKKAK